MWSSEEEVERVRPIGSLEKLHIKSAFHRRIANYFVVGLFFAFALALWLDGPGLMILALIYWGLAVRNVGHSENCQRKIKYEKTLVDAEYF